jgi:hypothetical protein
MRAPAGVRVSPELTVWERDVEVPRVSDELLETAVFIYPSVEDARGRSSYGGSGFLAGVTFDNGGEEWEIGEPIHVYVVTNRHVVLGGSRVVAITDTAGHTNVVELDWVLHPDGDDVAVAHLFPYLPIGKCVGLHQFMTEQVLKDHAFGPGDDVTMTGRFIGLDNRVHNTPTARFGHLSMGKTERVKSDWTGLQQESLLVEMRSLPGYSGSAVFVDSGPWGINNIPNSREMGKLWLLGIDWGHIPRYVPVLAPTGKKPPDPQYVPVPEGLVVQENSGMAAVVPAWKIRELLLDDDGLREKRDTAERIWRMQNEVKGGSVAPDSVVAGQGEPAMTRGQFENALPKVSRSNKPSPPAQ